MDCLRVLWWPPGIVTWGVTRYEFRVTTQQAAYIFPILTCQSVAYMSDRRPSVLALYCMHHLCLRDHQERRYKDLCECLVLERALHLQIYIVTRVCPELTPASQFPSENYTTYENYYSQKYNRIINNKHQPLLEVKAVSNKINCLRPRYCSIQLQAVLSEVP